MISEQILHALAHDDLFLLANEGDAWRIDYFVRGEVHHKRDADFDRLVEWWIEYVETTLTTEITR